MVVKVGTFNVFNLARPGEPYYPDEKPYSAAEYEKKAAWIAGQLGRMDADLVGFQEVFHEDALRDVCARSQEFADGTIVALGADGDRGPRLSLAEPWPAQRPRQARP